MELPFGPEFARRPAGGSEGVDTPILPLLAGYWSFGQFWGVWVILVFEFQRAHGISDSRLGLSYALLSSTAVVVMLLIAPRMQRFSLSKNVPLALASLGVGTLAVTYLPDSLTFLGFAAVRKPRLKNIARLVVNNADSDDPFWITGHAAGVKSTK